MKRLVCAVIGHTPYSFSEILPARPEIYHCSRCKGILFDLRGIDRISMRLGVGRRR